MEWHGGAVTSDGAIYCIPSEAEQVLPACIDPFKEFTNHPQRWCGGLDLFESSSCAISNSQVCAERVFQRLENALDECIRDNQVFEKMKLYPFMIAASKDNTLDQHILFHCFVVCGLLFVEERSIITACMIRVVLRVPEDSGDLVVHGCCLFVFDSLFKSWNIMRAFWKQPIAYVHVRERIPVNCVQVRCKSHIFLF